MTLAPRRLDPRLQMSGIPALRELRSQRAILHPPDRAIPIYQIAGANNCKPPYGAGLALYHLGRFDEADEAYLRALELCPRYAVALVDLGELRLGQQRYGDALELAQTAAEVEPNNGKAWANMGLSLYHLGRTDEALHSLDQALAIDPRMEHARAHTHTYPGRIVIAQRRIAASRNNQKCYRRAYGEIASSCPAIVVFCGSWPAGGAVGRVHIREALGSAVGNAISARGGPV